MKNEGRLWTSGRRELKLSEGRLGRGIVVEGIEGRDGLEGRVTIPGRLLPEEPDGGRTEGIDGRGMLGRFTLGLLGRVTDGGRD